MDETIYVILKLLFDFAYEVWFSILSTNVDQKNWETESSIAIQFRSTGDKWQSKKNVSSDFWSSFVDCSERFRLPPIWCEHTQGKL